MDEVEIRWDDTKNRKNQRKHGLSFEDVQELFRSGSDYLEIFDDQHSEEEDRFIRDRVDSQGPRHRGLDRARRGSDPDHQCSLGHEP